MNRTMRQSFGFVAGVVMIAMTANVSCTSASESTSSVGRDGGGGVDRDGASAADGATPLDAGPQVPPGLQLTALAYYRTETASRMLFRGNDPDHTLSTLVLEFLDAQQAPVLLDLDGDGSPDSSTFVLDAVTSSANGHFFKELQNGLSLREAVAEIAATPFDTQGVGGVRRTAVLSDPPLRANGVGCDPDFDACETRNVCAPGIAGENNTCATLESVQSAHCQVGPLVDASALPATVTGTISGASLWEPISGCVGPAAHGNPETIVRLHVSTPLPSLTISSHRPETTFDTVVYVVPGCPAESSSALGCNDDDGPTAPASLLVLHDVPAGDYAIVVDAVSAKSGSFGIDISSP